MIFIEHPRVVPWEGKSRLITHVKVDDEVRPLFFEVDNEYAQYLCFERGDAFVIALLRFAMLHKHDIVSEAPITGELLYKINEYLMPSLTKHDELMHPVKIVAEVENKPMPNAGAVGTGLSCGIDSFHAIISNLENNYAGMKLTHFCINSVGSFNIPGYKNYGRKRIKDEITETAEVVAKKFGLPLIKTNSNISVRFRQPFEHNHTYYSMFAVYCMQKLWQTYYYGSSGRDFSYFNIKNNSKYSTAYYELLSLPCFSTRNLLLFSEGGAKTRFEKIATIVDNPIVQQYLHVCWYQRQNCGICPKCSRTLLALDVLGKLDNFAHVFDVQYYKTHRKQYLCSLYASYLAKDDMIYDVYERLKKDITFDVKLSYWYMRFFRKIFSVVREKKYLVIYLLFFKISITLKH
ncbi:MAG: hypothetical protein E7050_10295 [Lentisphaerae bacterium]|nr:hypothetical protein [Lentisphaerota bacterium]